MAAAAAERDAAQKNKERLYDKIGSAEGGDADSALREHTRGGMNGFAGASENLINSVGGATSAGLGVGGPAATALAGQCRLTVRRMDVRWWVHPVSTNDLILADHVIRSNRYQQRLTQDVVENGVTTAISYVVINGKKYVVDGNHRVRAARKAGIGDIPAVEVTLPFGGYRDPQDVINEAYRK